MILMVLDIQVTMIGKKQKRKLKASINDGIHNNYKLTFEFTQTPYSLQVIFSSTDDSIFAAGTLNGASVNQVTKSYEVNEINYFHC